MNKRIQHIIQHIDQVIQVKTKNFIDFQTMCKKRFKSPGSTSQIPDDVEYLLTLVRLQRDLDDLIQAKTQLQYLQTNPKTE